MRYINLPRGKISPELAGLYNAYRQMKHVISDIF